MSDHMSERTNDGRAQGNESRRRQLRTMLLNAAGDARQTRQTPIFTTTIVQPVRRTIRERIAMLLSAAE
jgi:hypothetical protein